MRLWRRTEGAAAKVIEAVKKAGVAADDVQTQQVSVHPRYSNDGQEIVGFSAGNSVTAQIREIANVGAVIEAAVDAGANRSTARRFVVSERVGRYEALLEAAFADARAKAEALAAATGVTLGAVVNVVEGGAAASRSRAREAGRRARQPLPSRAVSGADGLADGHSRSRTRPIRAAAVTGEARDRRPVRGLGAGCGSP